MPRLRQQRHYVIIAITDYKKCVNLISNAQLIWQHTILGSSGWAEIIMGGRWFLCSLCCWVVCVFSITRCDHGKPNDETAGEERQDACGNLKAPRVRQMIFIGITAADPEVFALKSKRIVTKDHSSRHQEHTCTQPKMNRLKTCYNLQSQVLNELRVILTTICNSATVTKQQHSY